MHRARNVLPSLNIPGSVRWRNPAFFFERDGQINVPPIDLTAVPLLAEEGGITAKVRLAINRLLLGIVDGPMLRVAAPHKRSALFPSDIFYDADGTPYSAINVKGVGNIVNGPRGWEVQNVTDCMSSTGPFGFTLEPYALYDKDMTEKFREVGIHTHRVIAHLSPARVLRGGTFMLPGKFARRFAGGDMPIVQVRAFTCPTRLREIYYDDPESYQILMDEARAMINLRTGKEPPRPGHYLAWLVPTLACQVAKMHAAGWVHGFLTLHNITLDGAIVDLDSVEGPEDINDLRTAINADNSKVKQTIAELRKLLPKNEQGRSRDKGYYQRLYNQTYQATMRGLVRSIA